MLSARPAVVSSVQDAQRAAVRRALRLGGPRGGDAEGGDLWLRYFALGGTAGPDEVADFARGGPLDLLQGDLLARAVNERIDERTLLVPISHVLFKDSLIQDVEPIVRRAHEVGAHVILDCYQSAGIVPVDVTADLAALGRSGHIRIGLAEVGEGGLVQGVHLLRGVQDDLGDAVGDGQFDHGNPPQESKSTVMVSEVGRVWQVST